jgi:hypothetical protein
MLGFAFVPTQLVNVMLRASPQMKLASAPTIVVTFCAFRRICEAGSQSRAQPGATDDPERIGRDAARQ